MKIAWMSSWSPRPCGIATYSEELVAALRGMKNDVHIICHSDGGRQGEKNIYPVMNTEVHGWDEKVYDTVQKIDPDVFHIQHEYDGDDARYADQLLGFISKHKLLVSIGFNELVALERKVAPEEPTRIERYGAGDMLRVADLVITTSVLEGFGFAYLEPCILDRPVIG